MSEFHDQPFYKDDEGVVRFKPNRIVRMVLEMAPIGMNEIALMGFTDDERCQFAQLIGYSLGGYAELPYVSDEAYDRAVCASKSQKPGDP